MTYELIDIGNGKLNVKYSGGQFDGLIEAYYGQVRDGYKDAKTPNYFGLEQDLWDLLLTTMQSYATTYNEKGLTFTQILSNGKRGEVVNQQRLLSGLALMGIQFTELDKAQINAAFEKNNFTIRLT